MSDAYCSDCKRQTEVVFDHSAGDTVCSECGLVLESHSIDETSEWRTFANESGDNDPVRVGGPTNPLLADGGLSTVIAKPNGASGEFLSSSLGRWQNRGSNPDRGLIMAFKTIATMSDRYVIGCWNTGEIDSGLDFGLFEGWGRIGMITTTTMTTTWKEIENEWKCLVEGWTIK